jgi:hypothetical protein
MSHGYNSHDAAADRARRQFQIATAMMIH